MNSVKNVQKELQICVPVWGKEFTETFLKFCLMSLLSEENLPKIAKKTKIRLTVYTSRNSFVIIKKSENFKLLGQYADIDVFLIRGNSIIGSYRSMNDCHRHFISKNINKSLMLICPDMIFSNGALSYLYDIHAANDKTVCITAPRLDKHKFLKSYEKDIVATGKRALSNSDLLNLALKNFHPETEAYIMDSENQESTNAGGFYLKDSEGLIGYNFHQYPILFEATSSTQLPEKTIDSDFLTKNISDYQDIVIINDAIECCIVDVTDVRVAHLLKGAMTIGKIVKWAQNNTGPFHLNLFDEILYFRNTRLPPSPDILKRANSIQSQIKKELAEVRTKLKEDATGAETNILKRVYQNNSFLEGFKKIIRRFYIFIFGGLVITALNVKK